LGAKTAANDDNGKNKITPTSPLDYRWCKTCCLWCCCGGTRGSCRLMGVVDFGALKIALYVISCETIRVVEPSKIK
jgi:hypothetical protein